MKMQREAVMCSGRLLYIEHIHISAS